MPTSLRLRLCTMIFLQYVVPGAFMPLLSHYLRNTLGFSAIEVGATMAVPAVAAFIAPFIAAYVADRLVSAERLLACCHLLAGCIMLVLVRQTEYRAFFWVFLVYGLAFGPTFGLSNTVLFHHVTDAKREFGAIRLWGTVGWVAIAWFFGAWIWSDVAGDRLGDALYISAAASFLMGLSTLTLPPGHVHDANTPRPSPWRAVAVFMRPSVAVFGVLTFFAASIDRFYYYGTSPYLSYLGFSDRTIMPAMSIGQMTEIVTMFLFGAIFLPRFGIKKLLIIGMLGETFRYGIFALGGPTPLIFLALATHGVCFTFYFMTAFIYVNSQCEPDMRAGGQQLFNMLITGGGVIGGNLMGGKLGEWFTVPETGAINYVPFWGIPAALAVVMAILIAIFFHEEPPVMERKT